MKKLYYLICLLSLALVSCKTPMQTSAPLPPVVLNNSDSVIVETIVNTVYVPVEVAVEVPQQSEFNITPEGSSHVETDLAISDVWFENGILHHIIKNKSGKLKGETIVPQTTTQTDTKAVKIKEVPVPEPYPVEIERQLTLMEQIKLSAFWYLVGIIIVTIGFIFRKPFLMSIRKIIRL